MAAVGDPAAIAFPRALSGAGLEFSFSGLKSAVLNYLNVARQRDEAVNEADVAASFQAAVVDVLVAKTVQAARDAGIGSVVLAGGVAANGRLRAELAARCAEYNMTLHYPPAVYCTDNAAMIACRAYYQHTAGHWAGLNLNAVPALRLGERRY